MDRSSAKPKPVKPPKPSLAKHEPRELKLGPPIIVVETPEVAADTPKRVPPKPKLNRWGTSSSIQTDAQTAPIPPASRSSTPRPTISRTSSPLPPTPHASSTLSLDAFAPPVPAPRSPMLLIDPNSYLDSRPASPSVGETSPMLSKGTRAYEWAPSVDKQSTQGLEPSSGFIIPEPVRVEPTRVASGPALPPRTAPVISPPVSVLGRSQSIVLKDKVLESSNIDRTPPKSTLSLPFDQVRLVLPVNGQCTLVCTETAITLVADDLEPIWTTNDYQVTCCVADTDKLWIGMPSGLVACLDLVRGHTLFLSRAAHSKSVSNIWFDESQMAAISLGQDGKALVWRDFDTPPTVFRTVPTQISGALYHMGKLYVTTKNSLYVYDPFGETLYLTPRPVELPTDSSSSTRKYFNCIQTDGLTLICGHNDGTLSTFDLNTFQPIFSSKTGIHAINCITAVEGCWWLGLSSGSILVVDPHESEIVKEWKSASTPIKSLAVIHLLDTVVAAVDARGTLLWDSVLGTSKPVNQNTNADKEDQSIRIFSWNVDSRNPETMAPELIRDNCMDSDILVFGLQEVVELSNKTKTAKNLASGGDQTELKEYGLWKRYFNLCLGNNYTLVFAKALVGLYLIVFSKTDYIRVNECSLVKTGMGGLHGNKGGISLSINLQGTNICLINCHLAAGHTQIIQRNRDAAQILNSPVGKLKPLEHDYCFFFGDTNYRVNTARELAVKFIKDGDYNRLSQLDQLNGQRRKNPTFVLNALHEADLAFAPTYKFDRNSDRYDTSDKKRIPAWCDRILYRGINIVPRDYSSIVCQYSDHRPVTGSFTIQA